MFKGKGGVGLGGGKGTCHLGKAGTKNSLEVRCEYFLENIKIYKSHSRIIN
jgi:hypothetical protein